MKFHLFFAFLLLAEFSGSLAFSQPVGKSMTTNGGPRTEEKLRDQRWGIGPELGVLGYTDNTGTSTARGSIGFLFDWNAGVSIFESRPRDQYLGLASGLIYSHPGASDSDFFGTGSAVGSDSNLVMIPIDVKLGYHLTDEFRVAVRGGGNLIYRSNAGSMDLGARSSGASELLKIYPNVGLDLDLQVSKHWGLSFRPDLTLTPGNDLYVASIGASYIGF